MRPWLVHDGGLFNDARPRNTTTNCQEAVPLYRSLPLICGCCGQYSGCCVSHDGALEKIRIALAKNSDRIVAREILEIFGRHKPIFNKFVCFS